MKVKELKRILEPFGDEVDIMVCVNEAGYPESYTDLVKAQEAQISDDGDGLYESDPGDDEFSEMVLLMFTDEPA